MEVSNHFIDNIIQSDLKNGLEKIATRFPPEPNGFLHVGHAKSIVLNHSLAKRYGGTFRLRFDDTNPTKEDDTYVKSIIEDVSWLVDGWDGDICYASSYFETFYKAALVLIKKGKAYVDDLSAEEMREYRGTLTEVGKNSPYRDRSIEENLILFQEMRDGKYPDGMRTLRAKIDMSSPNLNMRDPVLYRIAHASHHQTGDLWPIYPMYDFAHPLEDAIEGITHSICTLEFEDHRPLYDWVLDEVSPELSFPSRPRQIEFARLELKNAITSKRKLKKLVDEGLVDGWDDPRLPTISGLRRRGYTKKAIQNFCQAIGVAKTNSVVDPAMLTHALREDLNQIAPRTMAVLRPLKLTIINYPENAVEWLEAEVNPHDESKGRIEIPFSKHLYIEQEDFREEANKKYHRLKPGAEVRLKHAYIVKCEDFIKDEKTGEVIEVLCSYDEKSKSGSGQPEAERKVKGTIHWISSAHAYDAEVHLLGELIDTEIESDDILECFNKASLEVLSNVKVSESLLEAEVGVAYQFLRKGYFTRDCKAKEEGRLVFNETVGLKDSFKVVGQ